MLCIFLFVMLCYVLVCGIIGGWTFGNCLAEASFSDRRWEMTVLDASGYLYVIGGEEYIGNNTWSAVNDVWKSTFAIRGDQRTKLQKACNIVWPQCTTGMSCYPGLPGTKILYDSQGRARVTCPLLTECYIPESEGGDGTDTATGDYAAGSTADSGGSSAGLSTGTAALIAVVVIVVVLALGYWYYRVQQSAPDPAKLKIKLDTLELLGPAATDSAITQLGTNTNPLNVSLTSQAQPV